jgi:hypothetical protein
MSRSGWAAGFSLVLAVAGSVGAEPAKRAVVVNGEKLLETKVRQLESTLRARIQPGSYWYDKATGGWGLEGGPLAGFTLPGLDIGGKLRADASKGNTKVFINGRELHVIDVVGLQQWLGSPVYPGRYWVDAQGKFGFEGGPALGNLVLLAQRNGTRYGRQGNTLTECNGRGCSSGNSNTGMGVITDGDGHGAVFTGDGKVLMTPN